MRHLMAMLVLAPAFQDAADVAELQPQKVGFAWVYSSDAGEGRATIVGREKVGDVDCFVREMTGGRGNFRESFSISGEGLLLHRVEMGSAGLNYEPPMVKFKAGTRKGDSWEWKGRIGGNDVETRFTNEGMEEIKVAAGTFKAWKIADSTKLGGIPSTGACWYAPGIGMIRIDMTHTKNGKPVTSTLELKSYEPAK